MNVFNYFDLYTNTAAKTSLDNDLLLLACFDHCSRSIVIHFSLWFKRSLRVMNDEWSVNDNVQNKRLAKQHGVLEQSESSFVLILIC